MSRHTQSYFANGKLLLTGEYFVLKGAKSLALPVRFGQKMLVGEGVEEGVISWGAFSPDGHWFSCKLNLPDFEVIESTDRGKAQVLSSIFRTIHQLNGRTEIKTKLCFRTEMTFNPEWGFGSSSTLIYNLANWAGVDPFQLNELCFKGSGFDIACASANGPIIYQRNSEVEEVQLDYTFQDQLYFVYSGAKKKTLGAVSKFLKEKKTTLAEIEMMNGLTKNIASCKTLESFQQLIKEHEELVSGKLGIDPVKKQLFCDFDGEIKSLGAWGGDYYLAAANEDEDSVFRYFNERGHSLIFKWSDLVLNRN